MHHVSPALDVYIQGLILGGGYHTRDGAAGTDAGGTNGVVAHACSALELMRNLSFLDSSVRRDISVFRCMVHGDSLGGHP